jgi:hypothetical protein
MPRRPQGTDSQPRTDAALFAHLAYKLEGINLADLEPWAKDLGLKVGVDALRKASSRAARLADRPTPSAAVRPALWIDWAELNFYVAIVRLRLDGGPAAIDQLEGVSGVVELFGLDGGGEALAVVIYERYHDEEALKVRLAEFGEIVTWEAVRDQRPTAAISTLRSLAREAAARENLLATGG